MVFQHFVKCYADLALILPNAKCRRIDGECKDMYPGQRILLVDDQVIIRKTLRLLLENSGCIAISDASNGVEALEIVAGPTPPTLIICDIRMSPMNGHEFLQHLRQSSQPWATLPVIFLTSQSPSAEDQAAAIQPDAYLLKPTSANSLRATIEDVLRRHQTGQP